MSQFDPDGLLADIDHWRVELCTRGLASEADAEKLRLVLRQSRGERLDTPVDPLLIVLLCGPTAVGKSSLINALAGAEISRPGLGATTSAALVYIHENDDAARLFEYSQSLGQLGRDEASVVRHDRAELLHKVLVDTPDIDSVVRHHRETTTALVSCADLVVFVTSPEKYKVLASQDWVLQQSRQRAIAFILNKWDRGALGLQSADRHAILADFRHVLAGAGFAEPLVFRVSTVAAAVPGEFENEIEALRRWLEAGLDRSAATAIQQRRRRAAWGRLGAAVASLRPASLSGHAIEATAADRLAPALAQAKQLSASAALAIRPQSAYSETRPTTPGLLGAWARLSGRIAGLLTPLRLLSGWRGATATTAAAAGAEGGFGQSAAMLLPAVTRDLVDRAKLAAVPLGPVEALWANEARKLSEALALLPGAIEAELVAGARKPSLRRRIGVTALYAVDGLILLVLLLALWRLAAGFVVANYASLDMVGNATALIVVLTILGQMVANAFFPSLQERLRHTLARQAAALIDTAWRAVQSALTEQLQATERLAEEGSKLLARMDEIVLALAPEAESAAVERLFGGPELPLAASAERPAGETAPRPVFD